MTMVGQQGWLCSSRASGPLVVGMVWKKCCNLQKQGLLGGDSTGTCRVCSSATWTAIVGHKLWLQWHQHVCWEACCGMLPSTVVCCEQSACFLRAGATCRW